MECWRLQAQTRSSDGTRSQSPAPPAPSTAAVRPNCCAGLTCRRWRPHATSCHPAARWSAAWHRPAMAARPPTACWSPGRARPERGAQPSSFALLSQRWVAGRGFRCRLRHNENAQRVFGNRVYSGSFFSTQELAEAFMERFPVDPIVFATEDYSHTKALLPPGSERLAIAISRKRQGVRPIFEARIVIYVENWV